ncbi:aminomethyltransferase [Terasakiella brassicae]|uniref:aminomethyltransferase n=1 Tax=Terasakiella brassicae TaxID=1634917 RepID=A0A917BSR8_9PROT|nr:glycine cleavage system aminomethyltransferase GcvT [Terasakiella brassicae]GGF55015.1 aminomethyltransferase [Terasakiella brassicae]
MSASNIKKTPLYDLHMELGAKMVEFAGWSMPINYPMGIMGEHHHCRNKAALFDVSHMAQVIVRGENRAKAFEALVPSNIDGLPVGKARYTFFTNDEGGIMDDLIVSNAGDYLFVVVNAAMRDQDIPHMKNNLTGCEVIEITDHALLAIQGPAAESVVAKHAPAAADLKFMETMEVDFLGTTCRISRLGYTGEDGYEISIPQGEATRIAKILLEDENLAPVGLGARDSLRLEAGLCLYGNDIDATTSPVEAQLNWAMQKRRREEGGFPGADRILKELAEGPTRKLVGIQPLGRAPARQGVEVVSMDGTSIGQVTSGGFGPTFEGPVALGYVASEFAAPDTDVQLSVRGKLLPAKIVKTPFVQQNYKR